MLRGSVILILDVFLRDAHTVDTLNGSKLNSRTWCSNMILFKIIANVKSI